MCYHFMVFSGSVKLGSDVELKKTVSTELPLEFGKAAEFDRGYIVTNSIGNDPIL